MARTRSQSSRRTAKTPDPFPPELATTGSPPAQRGGPSAKELDAKRDSQTTRFAFFGLAILLALIGLGGTLANEQRSRQRRRLEPKPSSRGKVSSKDASETVPRSAEAAREALAPAGFHGVLCVLFVASGAAALIYEVVWLHLLRLVIGASALSVGIVLASFMGGMFSSRARARTAPRKRPESSPALGP